MQTVKVTRKGKQLFLPKSGKAGNKRRRHLAVEAIDTNVIFKQIPKIEDMAEFLLDMPMSLN